MLRTIGGAIAGVVVWIAVVVGVSLLLRAVAHDLSAALNAHATAAALAGRLAISFIGSILGGIVAAHAAGEKTRGPLVFGILMLAIFVPYHSTIWSQFPLWYHLTFFVSLPVLALVGARLSGR